MSEFEDKVISEFEDKRRIIGLILFCLGTIIGTMILGYEGPVPSPGPLEHLHWLGYSGVALAGFGFLMAIRGENG